MTQKNDKIKVLALIYPIEKHVGHWACSSELLDIKRIIMSDDDIQSRIVNEIERFKPEIIAICGKAAVEYLDILDSLSLKIPSISKIPRVFRMQNSSLLLQSGKKAHSKKHCQDLCLWFKLASDPRWSWVFVQTLDDVDVVKKHLSPVSVSACPYGYDTSVFNPDLPELEREIDVGCYMNLRGDKGRYNLVAKAEEICLRRGWTFKFVEGVYWHDYARQIRSSKISLHKSIHSEVPFRMYETTVFGTVFVTDPLRAHVEKFYEENKEYVTYKKDFSNLEEVLEKLLSNEALRLAIGASGRERAKQYTWQNIADKYVAPALLKLLRERGLRC